MKKTWDVGIPELNLYKVTDITHTRCSETGERGRNLGFEIYIPAENQNSDLFCHSCNENI